LQIETFVVSRTQQNATSSIHLLSPWRKEDINQTRLKKL